MDAQTILRIKPSLTRYLHEFDDCFGRSQTRGHMATYVQGQFSDLPRKSVEPMADAAGVPPRTLQEFLSLSKWDESMMRDRLQRRVARRHGHAQGVGLFDETSFVKKGDKTACVQRQHCGAAGKTDNCVVSVHLGYATPDFHTLLDGELYLPEKTWDADAARRVEAGVPDEVTYRPKWRIALDQYRRALSNGVRFRWMTFDEGYGRNLGFLRELDGFGQDYVAEVPRDFHVWTQAPAVLHREHASSRGGRPRKYPRLKAKHNPTATVENVARHSPLLHQQPWVTYHVKDGSKGPQVWRARRLLVHLKDEHGLPTRAHHLLVAQNVLDPTEVKYFISNAPETTAVETLLLVAFSRWKIERMFEDSKMELGMDHFEVRKFGSIRRHLILSCVSHLFMAEFHLSQTHGRDASGNDGARHGSEVGKKKSTADGQPDRDGGGLPDTSVAAWRALLTKTSRATRSANRDNATAQRESRPQPSQADNPQTTRQGHSPQRPAPMSMAELIAL